MKTLIPAEAFVAGHDGTELATHRVGVGTHPVILCNGLGGGWKAWTHQIRYFEDRCSFLSWDYRGLYGSAVPEDLYSMTVLDHVEDALRVADAFGYEQFSIWGWSMGVQVALELFRSAPERVKSLVLINGAPTMGLGWSDQIPGFQRVLKGAMRGLSSLPGVAEGLTRKVVRSPETIQWAKRLGFASRTLDERVFDELAGSFTEINMDHYLRLLRASFRHDASGILADIDVPSLVISGVRDRIVAERSCRQMARRIAGAEYLKVGGGTHYVGIEYPELVNLRIEKFNRERGLVL